MEKNTAQITISSQDIIKTMEKFLPEIKTEYLDSGLEESKFNNFMASTIKEGLDNYQPGFDGDIASYFYEFIVENMNNKRNSKSLELLVLYLNEHLVEAEDPINNINNIKALINYVEFENIELNIENLKYLLDNCSSFSDILGKIVCYINESKDDKTIKNDFNLFLLLEDYASVKDIFLYKNEDNIRFSEDVIKQYLREIGKYEILSDDESRDLECRLVMGDIVAKEKLINHNLRLVVNIAKHYINNGLDFLDLIQQGNIGLIKAADKFDSSKNVKFISYAGHWIRHYITRAFKNQKRLVRKPVYVEEKIKKIKHIEDKLLLEQGQIPSEDEVARILNISVTKLRYLKGLDEEPASLNSLIGDSDNELLNYVEVNDDFENDIENKIFISEIFDYAEKIGLDEREIDVLKYRNGFYNNRVYTLRELEAEFGVKHSRINQIENKALKKIRKYYKIKIDDPKRKNQVS